MSFVPTPEQEVLRESARRLLAEHASPGDVRRLTESERGFDEGLWKQMAELGWAGIAIPEAHGGVGAGFASLAILLEEMGASLLCAPFFSSCVMAANAVLCGGSEAQKRKWLPLIADGSLRAAFAWTGADAAWGRDGIRLEAREGELTGTTCHVVDGHSADWLVVAAQGREGVGLYGVAADAAGITRQPLPTLDRTRKLARIDFERVEAEPLGDGGDAWPALSRALDRMAVALSCEMVGGARRCLEMAVEYAKGRTQFGRPIGSFQAIKHKCADMLIAVESGRSAAAHAAAAVDRDDPELPLLASLAKAYLSDAYFHVASENIQVHGGIGFTWEHDAHLYFRRAKASELFLGDAAHHRELVAQRLGI